MDAFGTIVNTPHIRRIESGYISIEFVLVKKILLLVEKESQTLNGVPLPFAKRVGS